MYSITKKRKNSEENIKVKQVMLPIVKIPIIPKV